MESVDQIMKELASMGNEITRKTWLKHGAPENTFGVKIGDMKSIVKRTKKNHELAMELFKTGNPDAMYLAGLIGDEKKMNKADLNKWAKKSSWYMISEYTVPFVAAESEYGWDLALEWINSNREQVAAAGWATLAAWLSFWDDEKLDKNALRNLLHIVQKDIHQSPNRVRYTMNGFVIALGSYVPDLTKEAIQIAAQIGKVHVDMGGTACKVPDAASAISKVVEKNGVGKKRKTVRC